MVSTPFAQAVAADLDDLMADECGFAEDVRLCPDGAGGVGRPVRAIFVAPGAESSPQGVSAPIVTVAPVLHIPLAAVQTALGRPLSTRDRIEARGRVWRVHSPQDSGHGLVRVTLLAVGGPPSPGTLARPGAPEDDHDRA